MINSPIGPPKVPGAKNTILQLCKINILRAVGNEESEEGEGGEKGEGGEGGEGDEGAVS